MPGFERYGKSGITVRHLLTHSSGLRPDVDLADPWTGAEHALALAVEEVPVARLDERVIYSDINYFVLGRIVERVSGLPLDRYARERIFAPLGMRDTSFRPVAALVPRIAPTERCPANEPCVPDLPGTVAGAPAPPMLRGVVHDPTARRMGGVAGHAGMFTTADDLARFCRMLLGQGTLDGTRILSPLTVARMLAPSTPAGEPNVRGLGWDLDSSFSSNRGELFPIGSFGHTGFTGTSMWIDPATQTYVVIVSSRVHPDGKGDVVPLRARLATIAAAAAADAAPTVAYAARPPKPPVRVVTAAARAGEPAPRAPVLTGIDVLRAEGFARLAGAKVALLTNHTGVARDGTSTIDLLHAAKNLKLVALFSPEHGIRGTLDDKVPSSKDAKTGLPIHSLYGDTRRPTDATLAGVDTIVVDLQDVGVRFYTYAATMALVMEEAARRGLAVMVLDRPNPIDGWRIEGPTTDEAVLGSTSYLRMPIRHGLTIGELAQLFNGERKIGAKLTVVRMPRWRRDWWFDDTGAPWINPSPNMRSLTQATLYPGIGAIEASNISVGRGTRHAVRADRRAVDRRPHACRGAQRAQHSGRARLPGPLHADRQRLRGQGVQRRLVHRHRPRGVPSVPAGHGGRGGAGPPLPEGLSTQARGSTGRIARHDVADPRRRGSSRDRRLVAGRRGEVAPAAGQVPDLHARVSRDGSGVRGGRGPSPARPAADSRST